MTPRNEVPPLLLKESEDVFSRYGWLGVLAHTQVDQAALWLLVLDTNYADTGHRSLLLRKILLNMFAQKFP